MKSKASLLLMEQLVLLLVFAAAAALCLRIFVHADMISKQTARRDEAVIMAQNAAEMLKSTGDPQLARQMFTDEELKMEILEEDSGIPGFSTVKIAIFDENIEIFALRTGWQEVAE